MEETRQLFSVWVRSGMSLGPLNFEVPVVTEAPLPGRILNPTNVSASALASISGPASSSAVDGVKKCIHGVSADEPGS